MLKGFLNGLKALVRSNPADGWDYGDRRSLVRLQCHFDIEGRSEAGKKFKGQIVDMSLKGMKLRGFEQLKAGDTVFITYPIPILEISMDTVKCRVLWVRNRARDFVTFAGLAYAEDDRAMSQSWVKYLLRQLGFSPDRIYEKRKYVRAECFVPAEVVYGPGKLIKGRLYNLGVGGALIEAPGALEPDGRVEVRIGPFEELPRFSLNGRVVNRRPEARSYLYGIEFGDVPPTRLKSLGDYLFFLLRNQWTE
ncbi:MAG: PilZ domain-containing protein [Armatimonadetes bacterium]|nr:PilZ domain-containing protein [Armatimonadota bacterium]